MDKEEIRSMIDDAMASAGEQFAEQARNAAIEAIGEKAGEINASIRQIAERLDSAGSGDDDPVDVKQAVADAVATALAERDEAARQTAQQAAEAQRKADARKAYIEANAAKIPPAYHSHIPETADEAELAAGLDAAIETLKADAEAYGWQMPDLGASAGGEDTDAQQQAVGEAEAKRSGQADLKAAYNG